MTIYNNLAQQRKKLLFRAWHRGIKEMDLILGRFAQAKINDLSEQQLTELKYIMSFEDRDLLCWFMGEHNIPKELDIDMFYTILNFHAINKINVK